VDAFDLFKERMAYRERVIAKADRLHAISQPDIGIPTRRRAKEAKKSFRRNARESQSDSMLNMPRPARHQTLPRFPSEKEKVLFAAHMKRRESGWIRG